MVSPDTRVRLACLSISFSAGLFGWDTGTIGAITTMPQFLAQFGTLSELMRGLVVAIILIPSAITGFVAGTVADRISRKYTVALGCVIFALGSAMSAGSNSLGLLFAARSIAGAGEGLFLSAGSVYVCEISPVHQRGVNMLLLQIFTTGAIAIGFFTCYGSIKLSSSYSWRIPFITSTITALLVAAVTPFLPYSPRYLLMRGRREDAEKVLDLLAGPNNREERTEMLNAGAQTSAAVSQGSPLEIFSKGVRGRTLLVMYLNMANQLTGIDFVLFFAPLLFTQAGFDPNTASFVASGVTGIVLAATVVLGSLYVEKVGRRQLFIWGGLSVGLCHILLGSMYASGAVYKPGGKWVVVALIEAFTITFAGSWSVCIYLYSNEISPSRVRSAAVSASRGANQLTNFIVAMTGPAFLAKSSSAPYFTYGAFTLFSALVSWAFCQETVGKTLETIDTAFEGSPYAVKLPFMTTEARQRRKSRSESQVLPGETRAHFRANLTELNMIGSAITE